MFGLSLERLQSWLPVRRKKWRLIRTLIQRTRWLFLCNLLMMSAAGGTRTPTLVAQQRILSPWRLPFRHGGFLMRLFSQRDAN